MWNQIIHNYQIRMLIKMCKEFVRIEVHVLNKKEICTILSFRMQRK